MSLEKQLNTIADKHALHRFIDNMPDDSIALIITLRPNAPASEDSHQKYNVFGNPRMDTLVWMIESFKLYLLGG